MLTCIICRFGTELDDAVLKGRAGYCICLPCFAHVTADRRVMPKLLRRQIEDVLAA